MCMTPTQRAVIDRLIEALQAMRAEDTPHMLEGDGYDMEHMAKAMAGFDSDYVGAGIAGNAWLDRDGQNVKRQWFVDNVAMKKKAMADGRIKTLGGIWVDHEPTQVIGKTMFEAVPDGKQVYIMAGPVGPNAGEAMMGKRWPMSVHYLPVRNKAGEQTGIVIFENSVVVEKVERNPLTAFRVYKRESATKGAIAELYGESHDEP